MGSGFVWGLRFGSRTRVVVLLLLVVVVVVVAVVVEVVVAGGGGGVPYGLEAYYCKHEAAGPHVLPGKPEALYRPELDPEP